MFRYFWKGLSANISTNHIIQQNVNNIIKTIIIHELYKKEIVCPDYILAGKPDNKWKKVD